MAPPGAGVRPRKSKLGTGYRLSAIGRFWNDLQNRSSARVSEETLRIRRLGVPLNSQPPHDFQQTGVVGKSQLLRRLGDVPAVSLSRLNHDLTLRFLLLLFEPPRTGP